MRFLMPTTSCILNSLNEFCDILGVTLTEGGLVIEPDGLC